MKYLILTLLVILISITLSAKISIIFNSPGINKYLFDEFDQNHVNHLSFIIFSYQSSGITLSYQIIERVLKESDILIIIIGKTEALVWNFYKGGFHVKASF